MGVDLVDAYEPRKRVAFDGHRIRQKRLRMRDSLHRLHQLLRVKAIGPNPKMRVELPRQEIHHICRPERQFLRLAGPAILLGDGLRHNLGGPDCFYEFLKEKLCVFGLQTKPDPKQATGPIQGWQKLADQMELLGQDVEP